MKGRRGTTDGSTLIGGLDGSGNTIGLKIDGSGNLEVAGTVTNGNPNGQASMANSSPVVLPTNQVPAAGSAFPPSLFPLGMEGFNSLIQPIISLGSVGAQSDISADQAAVVACLKVATNSGMFAEQVPDVFATITATASGDNAVWTPPGGNKFRLLRYLIEITQDVHAASAADLAILLRDGTTPIGVGHSVFIPAAAGTTFGPGYTTGWIDLGGVGYRSVSANNILNLNLSFALTSGLVRVIVAVNSD